MILKINGKVSSERQSPSVLSSAGPSSTKRLYNVAGCHFSGRE